MAKNKVNVDIKVDDNGTLKSTAKNAKAAAGSLNDVGKAAGTADRNLKGAAQASSNGTKNFSKMAQGISGGLVPAYATLAANVFAITAAFEFLKQAGDLSILQESQLRYSQTTGRSMTLLTSQLQAAARGMLSYQDAAQGAAIGAAAGLSNAQLEGLADAAYKASTALGRDLTDSFNRLTRGAIKAEPELLDELGIIIRLDTVTKDYARTLDVSANSLTAYQRTQAVTNAILEQSATKFEDLGENVNQVARLGKKFQDLLKDISRPLSKIANFIGKALADNVMALAGAFAFLGAGIVRSLAPAAPQFSNLVEKADEAVKSLSKVADTSTATGKKLAKATSIDDLTEKDLNYIDASQRSKQSKIIKYDTDTRKGIVKNLNIIRAQRKLAEAEQFTGIKRMGALWKAELALMQAEHGKFVGTIKAAQLALSKAFGRLLQVVSFVGIALTIKGIFDQILNSMKSKELKKFESNVQALTESFEAQKGAIAAIKQGFKEAETQAGKIAQHANLISNMSFNNLKDFAGLSAADNATSSDIQTNLSGLKKSLNESIAAAELQKSLVQDAGGNTAPLEAQIALLRNQAKALGGLELNIQSSVEYEDGISYVEEYNYELGRTVIAVRGLDAANKAATEGILNQQAALKGLGQAGESFEKLQDKIKQAPSNYRNLLDQFSTVEQALRTGAGDTIKLVSELTPAQQRSLETVLGTLKEGETVENVLTELKKRQLEILKIEATLERNKLITQRKYMLALHGVTPLQKEDIQNLQQRENLQNNINEILAKHKVHSLANLDLGDAVQKADAQRILNLQAQLDLLEAQSSLQFKIGQAAKNGLEKGLQTNLASLIKGDESSFRDALGAIAKAALNSVADAMAKQLTKDIMGSIFETPEQKIKSAMLTAADYHAQKIIQALQTPISISPQNKKEPSLLDPGVETVKTEGGTHTTYTLPATASRNSNVIETLDTSSNANSQIVDSMRNFTEENKTLFGSNNAFTQGLNQLFGGILGSFKGIFDLLFSEGGIVSDIGNLFSSAAGARYGGVLEGYSTGGIAKGSQKGFPAILHGTEAVVPLPNGNAIPVEMRNGSNSTNNVVVNVNVDSQGNAQTSTESQTSQDAGNLGRLISQAVQQELQNQKRSGGILNPYGAS